MQWILLVGLYVLNPATGTYDKKPAVAYFKTEAECEAKRKLLAHRKINNKEILIAKCVPNGSKV